MVHIRLEDTSDSANGNATAAPYDAIRLFVTAPEELSSLGDYDDWMTTLVTHEMTHVFHIDTYGGIPLAINSVIGKFSVPNQDQPHWILEGLAVSMESHFTGGGRLRSSLYDMYLRADVLEHNVVPLDVMSHNVRRWPQGDVWYLYGGRFIGWILRYVRWDTYAAVSADYGSNIIPWGLNRSIERATGASSCGGHGHWNGGRSYPQLYAAWLASLEDKYGAQTASARARGLREGTRLTHGGRIAASPRFAPPCMWSGSREELVYHRDDGDRPAGFYRLPLESRSRADESDLSIVSRADGGPLVRVVRRSAAWCSTHFRRRNVASASTSCTGSHRGRRRPWAAAARGIAGPPGCARAVRTWVLGHSSDVRHVARRHHDAPYRRRPSRGRHRQNTCTRSERRGTQAFTPRFWPDGRNVAYSSWSRGGYRDIRVVDVDSGKFVEITHDRAIDVTPSWSPDGR